ncbi:hypothetical protein [Streptomyces sp. NBC_01589]|uniref:hypothetical protein n=1 Tax=unclassified Streptomyces TaxID=2593676 RepID=UPI00386DECD9
MDGASQGLMDTTAATGQVQAEIFGIEGLAAGEYTVQIVKRSGQYTSLDGFKVTG